MVSLNTLRTKFGMVLSIVIGLALLAFVLSLKTEMGFSGSDPKVGSIDGTKVTYSEYLEAYDRMKAQNNVSEGDPQQADMLTQATWQALLSQRVLEPGFENLGVMVGDAERQGLIRGEYPSQVLYGAFADPRTGVYDIRSVAEFLTQAEGNPQAQQAWIMLKEQMTQEREVAKYLTLVKGGSYVNNLEVAQGLKGANNNFAGKWARVRYDAVPDSLMQVSSSEIRKYYDSHKNSFRQQPSRTISYVVFDVNATTDDMLTIENTAKSVGAEFAAAEDVKAYVRTNRNSKIAEGYVSAAQLPEDEAAALMAGLTYGPALKNNVWTIARVVDQKIAPDTLGVRRIVLPMSQEKLADSLLTALRAGADFAQVAQMYSMDNATAGNGGEMGKMPFTAFTGEYGTAMTGVKLNDVVKIALGDAVQLFKITYVGKPAKQVQIASITYPVEASTATRGMVHNAAGTFLVNAKGSQERFNDAASTTGLTPRVSAIAQGEREIRGVEDSRDIVRWASDAKKGDVSEILKVGNDYVVAILTDIDDEKYVSEKKAAERIEKTLLRDKKYDYIVKNASGSTFDAMTTSLGTTEDGAFEKLNYSMFYIDGVGVDPQLVGAITAAAQSGVVPAPVKGMAGVYVIEVENIATEEVQTPEAERVRAQARIENMIQQRSFQAIQQMSEVEDMTAKYF